MAMLKFKKGLWSKLPETKVEGTIYVTTDEKAMYVDISDSERIRLGDIIRVNTFNELQPPFSNEAFYYVESSNALLKRVAVTGENGAVTYEWKQINSTQDLADRLNTAEEDIRSLKGTVGSASSGLVKKVADNTTAIGNINTEIGVTPAEGVEGSGLKKAIADNAADIADLKAAVGMGEDGEVEGLDGRVTQAEKDIDALEGAVQGHANSISTLNGQVANKAEKSYVDDTFVTKTDASATYATKTELNNAKTAISSEIDADVQEEADRAVAAESALSGRIKVLEDAGYQNASQVEDAIDEKIAAAKVISDKYTDDAVSGLKTEVGNTYATKTELSATEAVVSGHTNSIKTINETLANKANTSYVDETFVKKVDADAKLAKIDTTKTVSEAIADAVAAEAALRETADTTHTNAISKLQNDLADVKTTADAAVTDDDLADAIKDFATTGQVATAKQEAIAAAKTAGDEAYAPIDLVETVNGINGTIGNATSGLVKDIADAAAAAEAAQDDIDAWETAHANDYTNAQIDAAIADAKEAGTDAGTQAETNRQNIAALTATVNKLDGTVETEGSVKKQIKDAADALETKLSAEIDADIRSANAMTFEGIINSQSDFDKITEAQVGDTYVIGTAFGNYQAGDFLIAKGEENEATGNIIDIQWNHVKSGYDASLDQKLTGADNAIKLSTGTGNAGTQVAFTATGSASVAVVDNTVTIGMVWEDFGE